MVVKFYVYHAGGRMVVKIGTEEYAVDELRIDVPMWAEFEKPDLPYAVLTGEGIPHFEEQKSGYINGYVKCRIVEG